jgi:RNase P subunit RPR2
MAVTYTLYCAACYKRLVESRDDPPLSVRSYESYFVCSCCSCETDRGFAVGDDASGPVTGSKRTGGIRANAV